MYISLCHAITKCKDLINKFIMIICFWRVITEDENSMVYGDLHR